MLTYFDNRHAEPLQKLINLLRAEFEGSLTQPEAEALAVLAREIERETTTTPYRLWLKEKQTAERLIQQRTS